VLRTISGAKLWWAYRLSLISNSDTNHVTFFDYYVQGRLVQDIYMMYEIRNDQSLEVVRRLGAVEPASPLLSLGSVAMSLIVRADHSVTYSASSLIPTPDLVTLVSLTPANAIRVE
jgi:hypothetical protein